MSEKIWCHCDKPAFECPCEKAIQRRDERIKSLMDEVHELLTHPKDPGARIVTLFGIPFDAYARWLSKIQEETAYTGQEVMERNYYLEGRLREVTSTIEAIPFSEREYPTREDMRVEIARLRRLLDGLCTKHRDAECDACWPKR